MELRNSRIIFFDGACIFCNSFIRFVVRRDKKKQLKLCPFQSQTAIRFAREYNFSDELQKLDSVIFLKDEKVFKKSAAAIEILGSLGGLWCVASLILLIPAKLRNYFYDYFGQNRYRWFGKKDFCQFDEEISKRILQ